MPELLIVLGVSNDVNRYQSLFVASGITTRELQPGAECVGSGVLLAKSLIERFYSPFDTLDDLILAACYVMYHTKRWTDGCGGNTDIIVSSIKRDFFGGLFSHSDIRILENTFKEFDEQGQFFLGKFANTNVSQRGFRKAVKELGYELGTIREKMSLTGIAESLKRFKPERLPRQNRKR